MVGYILTRRVRPDQGRGKKYRCVTTITTGLIVDLLRLLGIPLADSGIGFAPVFVHRAAGGSDPGRPPG